jgi:DNA-binding winged helix-turn-helix (wHTH) protein
VDSEKETLQRDGKSIPLQPKTFQILLVLIRHNQEVVSKDDLMKAVWPDTFVEEANLSRNIFMLRKALGESSKDHQYILTVPGRGYRLAESVRVVPEQEVSIVAARHSKVQIEVKESKPWGWIAVCAIVVVAVSAGAVRIFLHRAPVLTEKDTVVLADFSNAKGDPVFDETLRQGLAVQLEQSPYLKIISDDKLRSTLKQMGRQPDERLNDQVAREVCERNQSKVFISGSIAGLGSQYVLGLRAVNCLTGEAVEEQQTQVSRKEDVLNSLSKQSSILRGKLGESLASVKKFDVPLEQATTPSLEALQNYSLGMKQFYQMRYPSAGTLLQRAIELDPNFALAYARLASLNGNNQQSEARLENSAKAFALRERVTDRERLYIEAHYYLARGETEEASQAYELWKSTYPNDAIPNSGLAVISEDTGHFDKFLEESLQAYQKDVSVLTSWNLINAYTDLGRLDDAEKVLAESKARFPGNDAWLRWGYVLAYLRHDPSEMKRVLEAAPSGSTLQRTLLGFQFRTELYFGRQREADEYRRRATQLSLQLGIDERAALYAAVAALQAADNGDFSEAQRIAVEVPLRLQAKNPLRRLALAYARSGDVRNTERVADQLAHLYPTDTLLKNRDLPLVRAAIAVQ